MSELLVNTIKKADGTGSLTVPAESGTVVTTASPSLGRRNLIINGAMQVAQRGTSFTTDSAYPVDRFGVDTSGPNVTKSQESLTSSDSPYALGFRKSIRLTNTAVNTSTSAFQRIVYKIEAQDIASSGWNYTDPTSYITFSFWVRSSLAGTYYSYILTPDSPQQAYSFSYTVSANTWTQVTKKIPGNSNIVINTDNTNGFQIETWLFGGTNFTDPTNVLETWAAWNSSNRMPDFAQDWGNTASATFDLTGVQLEVGSVATPFEHRSYGEELALCQRYYYRNTSNGVGDCSYGIGTVWSTAQIFTYAQHPTTMRANPTTDFNGTFEVNDAGTVRGVTLTAANITNHSARIDCAGSGFTTGRAVLLRSDSDADAWIGFSAEL